MVQSSVLEKIEALVSQYTQVLARTINRKIIELFQIMLDLS